MSLMKFPLEIWPYHLEDLFCLQVSNLSQHAKLDLDKKSFPKQKTIQNFTIDAQGFRKI